MEKEKELQEEAVVLILEIKNKDLLKVIIAFIRGIM